MSSFTMLLDIQQSFVIRLNSFGSSICIGW
jgi:hypothetical protein